MKKNSLNVIVALLLCCAFCRCTAQSQNEAPAYQNGATIPSYYAPTAPSSFTIFGEKVDMSNYYIRERFDRELLSFSYWHSQVFLIIKRANKYFPIIEPILKEEGVPDDFKYLALIESNLDPRVVSPAKAAGMWQILAETAKEGGLVVNDDVDERYNLEKATRFACAYLKQTYEKTGSWTLAAASYNCGRNGLLRKMETQQCNNYFEILFGEETNRYVFRIMLAKYMMENPQKFGFLLKKEDLYYMVDADFVKVDSTITNLTEWAKEYGLSYQLLKDANPWLRSNKITNKEGREFVIRMPKKEDLHYSPDKIKVHNTNWIVNP